MNAFKGGWRDELRLLRQILREQDERCKELIINDVASSPNQYDLSSINQHLGSVA